MTNRFAAMIFLIILLLSTAPALAQDADEKADGRLAFAVYDSAPVHPIVAKGGMVAAQEAIAARVGADILKRGGNAVDAAVATGFALAVTHPQAGNLGGGGFMMISLASTGEVLALDFREMAPSGSSRDMFLGSDGEVDNKRARFSHLSAGVPGSVMGLLEALEKHGTMSRRQVMAPAIKLARRGFPLSYGMAQSLAAGRTSLSKDASSIAYFYGKDGKEHAAGERLVQRDLAATLRLISAKGADGFYTGKTADLIVEEMQRGGGLISHEDLKNYHVKWRAAVHGTYRGYDIYSMPPPSSGGIHLVQMLNILEGYSLGDIAHNSADYLHLLIEAMRRAFADRSKYLGDPDFAKVPQAALISKAYAKKLRAGISKNAASNSAKIAPGLAAPYESPETTHYSVMDRWGNAAAVTTTLNFSFGSGFSVDGAGFLLNNEMDDFSAKPGAPNGYGLIGGVANAIEPAKRPLSSMTPTIVKKDGKALFLTGSPGGSTIITTVLQTVLNVIDFKMNAMEAVAAPRIHHQWLPDIVIAEPGIGADTLSRLEQRGHKFLKTGERFDRSVLGRANAVMSENGLFFGAPDMRAATAGAFGPGQQ